MNTKPRIALTAARMSHKTRSDTYEIPRAYLDAVLAAGGVPILLPTNLPLGELPGLLERFDGLLLSGGGDLHPARYGEAEHPEIHSVDPERDAFELALIPLALAADKPLLAICRGCQALNAALGGSLYWDIASQLPEAGRHDWYPAYPRDLLAHKVRIEQGTKLAEILGARSARVNSLHHQAVRKPGRGVVVSARAEDGVIEGIELPEKRFALGVQWHPECLPEDERMRVLFTVFVQAARE
ncbi:MAG: gamma-glutamyl-gamma-aminobutyrate hydrolase family protein [Chloroflexi bacterium]|jgi:putative glutamine amidotransferase|nr:gamma-glutamyl-gamma-aminobutyrate hydrolase family protein [Anaerolineaceae bacterium]NLI44766.1 gamma-glutamyl-gamma-aminobutyrate hydrolase family protein [Chloroflexota bacterium]HOE35220.1 gamma-glutamyl-gamma-aminobutyrate hydrolase family protein [Anaerolineaceae bacterium]HOT25552.1 gamma-glutamyl-gamma-aminobutyrate hydrolase family protein [Anaerolineaceae bacterium]HQK03444.1 gamma-glutamyl-gamma-aminobutyrate hydrolase family protein [Anaerolineaceae bacterium]